MNTELSPTFQDVMYLKIRSMLLRGEFRPGELLSRRRLAEQLEMRPSSVQHVLDRLEGAGLVERKPQSGTYLRELTPAEIEQTQDLRELVEPYLAHRAATRMTPAQKRLLKKSIRRTTQLSKKFLKLKQDDQILQLLGETIEEEHIFHGTIAEAGENPPAAQVIEQIGILLRTGILAEGYGRKKVLQNFNTTITEHQQIFEALMTGNAQLAEAKMRAHVCSARI